MGQFSVKKNNTVSFTPYITANNIREAIAETEGEDVEWKLWYYDESQGNGASREFVTVTLDRDTQLFSFTVPCVQMYIVYMTYNPAGKPRENVGFGGLPEKWEILGSDGTDNNSEPVNLTNGLVAHYEFEGDANDSSGNGNHGAEYGGVSYVDGVIGKAGSFDGVDDYIEVQDSSTLDITDKITISIWVNASSSEPYARIVSRNNSGVGNRQYNLALDETGQFVRTVLDTENTSGIEIIGVKIDDESWHHLVMTFDKDNIVKLYVDNILNGSLSVNSALVSKISNLLKTTEIRTIPKRW